MAQASRVFGKSKPAEGMEEHEIAAQISMPKDGGWGWVVCVCSLWSMFILDGVFLSFGSVMNEIASDLKKPVALVSLVSSTTTSLYYLVSPVASALINRFGFRPVAMSGSIVTGFSLLATYFTQEYPYILLFYGICCGFGCSLINMSATLIVGFYFERLRAVAMAIALFGGSFGVMIMFPVNSYLCGLAGWRATILVHSGMCGMIFFFAMSYRPLLSVSVKTVDEAGGPPKRSVVYLPSVKSVGRMPGAHTRRASEGVHGAERLFGAVSNVKFPTAAAILDDTSGATRTTDGASTSQGPTKSKLVLTPLLDGPVQKRHLKQVQSIASTNKFYVDISGTPKSQVSQRKLQERPMYRDDAFFDGDIKKLPEYKKSMVAMESKTGLEYQLAVTRMVSVHDLEERRGVFTTAVRRVLATMMDPRLLRNKCFLCLLMGNFTAYIGLLVPSVCIKDRNINQGMDPQQCTIMASVLAGCNALGRVLLGVLAGKFNPLSLYIVVTTIAGTSSMLSFLSYTPVYQFMYVAIYGFCIAGIATLRSIALVNLFGLDKLTSTSGMIYIGVGIGSLIGVPLATSLKQAFGTYNPSFIVSGAGVVIAAIMMLIVKKISSHDNIEKIGTAVIQPEDKKDKRGKVKDRKRPQQEEKKPALEILDPEKYKQYLHDKKYNVH